VKTSHTHIFWKREKITRPHFLLGGTFAARARCYHHHFILLDPFIIRIFVVAYSLTTFFTTTMSNRNDEDIRSDDEPKAEAANKKIKQETQADGLPPPVQPRLATEPTPAFSEDPSNLRLPHPPLNPYSTHIAYNPLGPFVPSQFPFIPSHAYHPPHNLPYPVHPPPPPFHLAHQPQYPNPPASMHYYEARMRDHAAA
jgi:hypothetical protein